MIGKTISHYKILEKLGEGGMGVVFKAHDTKLDRIVALKFFPSHLTTSDTDKARFLQEAKAAAALNHPNVCTIHEIHDEGDNPFIVMEYVEGKTLRDIVHDNLPKVMNIREIIDIAIQTAEALNTAHSKDIVHRDIKSENIMITETGQIKVMDFGLAKLRGSVKLTKTSSTVGTLAYMSPEHLQGKDVDARCDIFSFGVVLYEMLTGQLPFKGEYDSAIMYAIMNEEPEPVQKYRSDLSSELLHILNRSLEKEPGERYQSVDDMLIDLERLKRDTDEISRKSPAEIPVRSTRKKTLNLKIGIILIAALIGVAVIFYALFQLIESDGKKQPFEQMQITRETTHGKAKEAAISPDGKYIIHVMEKDGKQSLWLRQVATASNVEILPPTDAIFRGLTFTIDGNYIYYDQREKNSEINTLYRMPVLGGTPITILESVYNTISFSPDGSQFTFLRINSNTGETTIFIANTNGTEEKVIAKNKFPDEVFVSSPSWSPDGSVILYGEYIADEAACRLVEIKIEDKSKRIVSSQKWRSIDNIVWLPNSEGLLLTASYQSFDNQIWYISYPEASVRRITNDLNHYKNLSITHDEKILLTVQEDLHANIWLLPKGLTGQVRQITSGKNEGAVGIDWTPDGNILFATYDGKIWVIGQNGNNPRRLSSDENYDFTPAITSDGQYIYFTSSPVSAYEMWRMNSDGSNRIKLEDYAGDPQLSPDGQWIVYTSLFEGKLTLCKISINGGKPIILIDNPAFAASISHDGKRIACFWGDRTNPDYLGIAVLPFEGGEPLMIFDLPRDISEYSNLRWTLNDDALTYFVDRDGISNIYSMPLTGSSPVKLTNFNEKLMFYFDWSHDGDLACSRGEIVNDVVLIKDLK